MTAKDFLLQLPNRVNPEAVGDANTVFHIKLTGDEANDYTVRLQDRQCSVVEGLDGEAKCVVTADAKLFADIVQGRQNPQMAVFTGKLKISNLGEMMKYAKVLGLM